jgi:hypothetical protein
MLAVSLNEWNQQLIESAYEPSRVAASSCQTGTPTTATDDAETLSPASVGKLVSPVSAGPLTVVYIVVCLVLSCTL